MMATLHPPMKLRARRGPLAALLATLAAAALLLIGSVQPAAAAPPSLSASENPVVIPNGTTTKNISVSWNLNGYQAPLLSLNVQETSGPVVASASVISQTGATPLTVTYGKTYTATLLNPTTGATLATLQITTKRPNLTIPGDLADCIVKVCVTGVTFAPHGTYAEFTAKTTKPALFQMAVGLTAPNANGDLANPVSGIFNLSHTSEWKSHVMGLQPNVLYFYVLKAEDQQGNKTMKTGTFLTLKRRVEVTFEKVTVTDDSDDLSACDCTFWFKAHNEAAKSYGEVSVSTGSSVYPNVKFTVNHAPDTMTLRVEGQDDDSDGFTLCTNGTAPSWSVGNNSCMSWTGGSFTVNTAATGFGEEFTETFSGPWFNYSGELNFHLYGSYKVTYVP